MTTHDATLELAPRKAPPPPRHGVDVPAVFATIDAVRAQPSLGRFVFRAQCRWREGTHSTSTLRGFYGAGEEREHAHATVVEADHPAVLCGADRGVTPVEHLLHALASCLTAGIANIAAARRVTLESVESTVEGDIDLAGIFGISEEVRNGYGAIRVRLAVRGDAPEEKLAEIVRQSVARSAVYDMLTNGTRVTIEAA